MFGPQPSTVGSPTGRSRHANILVVDDDAQCRQQLKQLIEPFGWTAIEACDGEEAIEKIAALGREALDMAIVVECLPFLGPCDMRVLSLCVLRSQTLLSSSCGNCNLLFEQGICSSQFIAALASGSRKRKENSFLFGTYFKQTN